MFFKKEKNKKVTIENEILQNEMSIEVIDNAIKYFNNLDENMKVLLQYSAVHAAKKMSYLKYTNDELRKKLK